MNHTLFTRINHYARYAQEELFPILCKSGAKLTPKLKSLVNVFELLDIDSLIPTGSFLGRKQHDRVAFVRAFFAKTILQIPTTNLLIERLTTDFNLAKLCGFSTHHALPHKSSFSRAFAQFANNELAAYAHQRLVETYLGDQLIGHISYDSTAIAAREKSVKKDKKLEKPIKYGRGRPKKDEVRRPKADPVIVTQQKQTLAQMIDGIKTVCNKGAKKDSQGFSYAWNGYKLHLAIADGDIPICAFLSSASVHDSQVMMPLMLKTSSRVTSLYDLADAAYCSPILRQASKNLGHVPLIDHNPRRGEKIQFDPCEAERYKQRSSVERCNSYLKDNHLGRSIYVKGAKKVMSHLMFGVAAIAAMQILRLIQ